VTLTRKGVLPYAGILLIGAALLLVRSGRSDAFTLLCDELLIALGYIAAIIDVKSRVVPNRLIVAMLAIWTLIIAPQLLFDTDVAVSRLMDSLLGLLTGGGVFLLLYIASRKGLGGGDVKFMAVAGLFLGFQGVLPTILCGALLAVLYSAAMLLLKKKKLKDTIPFIPFLYAGILITLFLK